MELLNETSKTSAAARFSGAVNSWVATRSEPANPAAATRNPELWRQQEIFAWIMIAAIWAIFALSLYLIWIRASDSV